MMKQRWGLDRNVLRPTPGDPWGVEQHHWNTGAKENQQLNPGGSIRDLDIDTVSLKSLFLFSSQLCTAIYRNTIYSAGEEKFPLFIFLYDQLPFFLGETGRNSGKFLQEIQYFLQEILVFLPEILRFRL